MKVTLVKNDKFETIGVEAIDNGVLIVAHGISPLSPLYWTKTIENDQKLSAKCISLLKMKTEFNMAKNFSSKFFDVALDNELIKSGQGVNFTKYDEVETIEIQINRLIQSL